jgi:glycosyltransferase involved in cell wall biosynthesis
LTVGVPVVASAVGGTPDQLGGGRFGYLVPAGDEAAAVAALRRALAPLTESTAAATEDARERFSAKAMADKVIRFYQSLLANQEASVDE